MADNNVAIHIGVVHHRHGVDAFVGWSQSSLYESVYEYVKEWWSEFPTEGDEPPEDHEEAIRQYFNAADGSEYMDELVATLPPRN